jgi:hypothetical protein
MSTDLAIYLPLRGSGWAAGAHYEEVDGERFSGLF